MHFLFEHSVEKYTFKKLFSVLYESRFSQRTYVIGSKEKHDQNSFLILYFVVRCPKFKLSQKTI